VALNIKSKQVEQLVQQLVEITGESKTECVRRALLERRARLSLDVTERGRGGRLRRLLESEVWPTVPPDQRGRRWSREEEEEALGLGRHGV